MKKFFTILLASVAILGGANAWGQAKITTKKVKLADFTTKTTKVVLAGNELFNTALKNEISSRWMVSPYEFCTVEEYEAKKLDVNNYFLVPVSSKLKKEAEPGIVVLSLCRGGNPEAPTSDGQPMDIVSIPCCSLEFPSGREFVYLPALIDIIQAYVTEAMASDLVGYGGLGGYTATKILKERNKKIVFSKDDLAPSVTPSDEWLAKNIETMDEDDADELFSEGAKETLVSYVVAPTEPQKGSVCYKMIISADTHQLCFFEKHQIKGGTGAGFLPLDIKLITAPRKSK